MANISGRSFLATLSSVSENRIYPIGYLREQSIDGSGWLVQLQGGIRAEREAIFRFDFIEEVGNRLHYTISAGPGTYESGAKIGVSLNGYLGFYSVATVTDFLKIELEGENTDPNTFEFILRDARGYRVGHKIEPKGGQWTGFDATHGTEWALVRYLNVNSNNIIHFQGRIIQDI